MNLDWYEVWADESSDIPYLLLLCPNKHNPNELLIIDPKENNSVIQTMASYNEAALWLAEDEYTIIKGRMHYDD